MKGKIIWRILLCVGISPFLVPVFLGIYRMSIESWTFLDWLVLYSFLYWPTYLLGLALIVLSVCMLFRHRSR